MKKLLALMMALVMTMSLVTISNAAFSDAESIENKEAVEVMNALGVINGMGNGSFAPKGNVTRAQMAKMITIIMLGDIDPTAFIGTATELKDINGHWAEGYIKYCYSQGIIAGKGEGKFDPDANVTATEAAKMLLVAIGYNANVQGYIGTEWTINTVRDAQLCKFYDKLSVTSAQLLTREQAAQMIYNAIKTQTVVKTSSIDRFDGSIVDSYIRNGAPLLTKTFNAKEYVGVMDSVTYTSSNEKYTYLPIGGVTLFENKANSSDTKASFVTKSDYTQYRGEEVSVIEKTETNGDKTVLGIWPTGKSVVLTSAVSALEVDGAKLKVNGVKYELEGSVTTALAVRNSYNTIKLVDSDNNGKLDRFVLTTIVPGKVTYVSDKEIIAGDTYKFEDDQIESGIAKKNYVTAVQNVDGSYTVSKLDAITGKVDGAKTINGAACVRVNGEWYVKNGQTLNIDSTYTFYAVNGVIVVGSVDQSTADIANLVMVLDVDSTLLVNRALVMDNAGARKTVGIDSNGVTPVAGQLYTFTETDEGYKFTAAATIGSDYTWTNGGTNDITTAGGKLSTINSTAVADNAVIYVQTSDGGKVITGKQFKSIAASLLDTAATKVAVGPNKVWDNDLGSYSATVNGLPRISHAGIYFNGKASDLIVSGGNELYAYVTSDYYTVASSYTTYTIWTGSENLTVVDKGANTPVKGTVITYDAITDGYISGVSVKAAEAVAIRGIEGDYVYADNTTTSYKITGDTKYLYVDSGASSADEIGKTSGTVERADKYADSVYMDNAMILVSSGEYDLIVVDVKNNFTNSTNKTLSLSNTNSNVNLSVGTGLNKLKVGDAIEITATAACTVTVANAKLADNTTVSSMSLTAGQKITVFAIGGNVSVS